MNIKRNIIFTLEKRKKNGVAVVENVPIRMRVIHNGKRVEFTTGYRVDAAKWDEKQQKVRNGTTNKFKQSAAEINAALLRYGAEMQETFKEFEVADMIPDTEQLKQTFNRRTRRAQPTIEVAPKWTLFECFDEFTKECGRQNDWTTFEKFKAVKAHLAAFDLQLTFARFTEEGLNEYVGFLRDTKNLRNSTIGKQVGFLKWFLRWAFKKGYHTNAAFDMFRPKLKNTQKKVIFLTWDELTRLREYAIPATKQYLERVRDVFLFQCFTSLRYSDVCNLRRSDIKENHIEITTVKTADSLERPQPCDTRKIQGCCIRGGQGAAGSEQSEDERLSERVIEIGWSRRADSGNLLQRQRTHRPRNAEIRIDEYARRSPHIHLQCAGTGYSRAGGNEMDGA